MERYSAWPKYLELSKEDSSLLVTLEGAAQEALTREQTPDSEAHVIKLYQIIDWMLSVRKIDILRIDPCAKKYIDHLGRRYFDITTPEALHAADVREAMRQSA